MVFSYFIFLTFISLCVCARECYPIPSITYTFLSINRLFFFSSCKHVCIVRFYFPYLLLFIYFPTDVWRCIEKLACPKNTANSHGRCVIDHFIGYRKTTIITIIILIWLFVAEIYKASHVDTLSVTSYHDIFLVYDFHLLFAKNATIKFFFSICEIFLL